MQKGVTQALMFAIPDSTLLRSPTASQGQGGALGEAEARKRGNTVGIRDQAMDLAKLQGHKVSREVANLPTPTVSDQYTGNLASTQQKPGSMHSVTLAQVFHKPDLFPTPVAADWKNGRPGDGYGANLPQIATDLMPTPKALDGVKGNLKTSKERLDSGHQVDLPNVAIDLANDDKLKLFNTPTTMDAKATNDPVVAQKFLDQGRQTCLTYDVATNWGKFGPAIRRWESIIGRPAPDPTKPDGKDNNHRLSSKFTEWMMGLPDGWITGHNLKRNDELKLAGNGVVPQQAELALRLLLELPERKENNNE
jgi:DNA (cytosine-5)-methyltransferase 1